MNYLVLGAFGLANIIVLLAPAAEAKSPIPFDIDQICSANPPATLRVLWRLVETPASRKLKDAIESLITIDEENQQEWDDLAVPSHISFCGAQNNEKVGQIRFLVHAVQSYTQAGMPVEADRARQEAMGLIPETMKEVMDQASNPLSLNSRQMDTYLDESLDLSKHIREINQDDDSDTLDQKVVDRMTKWGDAELKKINEEMKKTLAEGETLPPESYREALKIIQNLAILGTDYDGAWQLDQLSKKMGKSLMNQKKKTSCPPVSDEIRDMVRQGREIIMNSHSGDGAGEIIEGITPYAADYAKTVAPDLSPLGRAKLGKFLDGLGMTDLGQAVLEGRPLGKPKCEQVKPTFWVGDITLTRVMSYSNKETNPTPLGAGVETHEQLQTLKHETVFTIGGDSSEAMASVKYDSYTKLDRVARGKIGCYSENKNINFDHHSVITDKGEFQTEAKVMFRGLGTELKVYLFARETVDKPLTYHETSSQTGNVGCEEPVNKQVNRSTPHEYWGQAYDFLIDLVLEDVTEITKTITLDPETKAKIRLKKISAPE